MNNSQFSPIPGQGAPSMPVGQPMPGAAGQPGGAQLVAQPLQTAQPIQMTQPGMYGGMQMGMNGVPGQGAYGGQAASGSNAAKPGTGAGGIVKLVAIIVLSLTTVTFLGLFIWMMGEYNTISTDVNGQIDTAVIAAKNTQALEDEAEFAEREKYPYSTFAGPVDYGQLSFEYPKTWSVYVAEDAANGGDFEAYLNPGQVDSVSDESSLFALVVRILDQDFETVTAWYQRELEAEEATLTVETTTVGGTMANRYSGLIPDTEFTGYVVIFKIRDKTAILQTDSVLFTEDFNKIISSVKFNA